jgi:hypothetical protein
MQIVINKCYGGFGLSPAAILRLHELNCAGIKKTPISEWFKDSDSNTVFGWTQSLNAWRTFLKDGKPDTFLTIFTSDEQFVLSEQVDRDDPLLVRVIQELGDEANGYGANLKIVDIPDGVKWYIEEYDGKEHIAEVHQKWY